ncbi:hypothetical protein JB92DRAFT_978921 [Gautieria morchelliformis]|nr:hypothetical protein JB92DRAFT_978921 [Gautieria morchelliformis]
MFGLRRCPCTLCKKTAMPWQQSRTIKRHLQRDAEALELANSNHVENDATEFSLDGERDANSLPSDPETLPDNCISAVETRETQEIKGDDLCSYAQYDDGGDWYGSEASDSLSDQHQPPVHQSPSMTLNRFLLRFLSVILRSTPPSGMKMMNQHYLFLIAH